MNLDEVIDVDCKGRAGREKGCPSAHGRSVNLRCNPRTD